MHYLLLLANAPDNWESTDKALDDGVIDDWAVYTRALRDAGVLVDGGALHDPDVATSVQVRGGRRVLLDGPYAETKEHLIGYYVIDVADLDAAIGWAAQVPNVRTGTVEVRPIRPGSDPVSMLAAG